MTPKLRFGILLAVLSLFVAGSVASKSLTPGQILNLVNQDRGERGLAELTLNPALNLAAQAKARDMVSRDYFAHVSPDGTKPWSWLRSAGYNYTYAGENLAEGYTDAYDLETSWMASPAHRANILSPFYSEVGLAVIPRDNTNIVVQFFGSQPAMPLSDAFGKAWQAGKDNKVTLRQ